MFELTVNNRQLTWANTLKKIVLHHKVVCFILLFVGNCLFLYLSKESLRPIGLNPYQFYFFTVRNVCVLFLFLNYGFTIYSLDHFTITR